MWTEFLIGLVIVLLGLSGILLFGRRKPDGLNAALFLQVANGAVSLSGQLQESLRDRLGRFNVQTTWGLDQPDGQMNARRDFCLRNGMDRLAVVHVDLERTEVLLPQIASDVGSVDDLFRPPIPFSGQSGVAELSVYRSDGTVIVEGYPLRVERLLASPVDVMGAEISREVNRLMRRRV